MRTSGSCRNRRSSTVIGRFALGLALIINLIGHGQVGAASLTSPDAANPTVLRLLEPDVPSAESVLQAHDAVKRWLGALGDDAVFPGQLWPKVIGASVTLRYQGEVIARGSSWAASIAGPAEDGVLKAAAAKALEHMRAKLPLPNDARQREVAQELVQQMIISVELAGPGQTLSAATWEDVELTLQPGLDGVAARVSLAAAGNLASRAELFAMFPSQMMLTETLPHRALSSVCARAIGGDEGSVEALSQPQVIRERHKLAMYSFRTAQAANSRPGQPPVVLFRGKRLLPAGQLPSAADVRELSSRLAENLLSRLPRKGSENTTLSAGDIQAGMVPQERTVQIDPEVHMLSLYALAMYAQARSKDLEPAFVSRLNEAELAAQEIAERAASNASAMAMLTIQKLPGSVSKVRSLQSQRMWPYVEHVCFDSELLPPTDAANLAAHQEALKKFDLAARPPLDRAMLLLFALRRGTLEQLGTGQQPANAGQAQVRYAASEKVLRRIYADVGEGPLVSLMPWLGWAELEQARRWLEAESAREIAGAVALRRMREQVWKHQLGIGDAGSDGPDMVGGIVFTAGVRDGRGTPYPTWQCLRPLTFIATMLGDPKLTEPTELGREIVRLMQVVRFIQHLQVDESMSWLYPQPAMAIGGARRSVWDPTVSLEATAFALMFTVEFQASLDRLAQAAPGQ